MARRTTVELIDDIDGGAADETVEFSVNGKAFSIDLSAENARRFHASMEGWTERARRVGSARASSQSRSSSRDPGELAKIREWAEANGYTVARRGRIAREVEEAYRAAHG